MDRKRAQSLSLAEGPRAYSAALDGWIVIGYDYTEREALDAYAGNDRACALIRAVRDLQRTKAPPPEEFWRELLDGVNDPIRFVNLGKDGSGVEWLVVVDGRNRCMGAEQASKVLVSRGEEPLRILGMEIELPRDTDKAVHIVLTWKTKSAVRVAMKPSHWAERAAEWNERKLPLDLIGEKMMLPPLGRERRVGESLALYKCIQPIQDAVDSGALRDMKGILAVAEKPDDDQEAWLAGKLTPASEKKARGYAVPATFHGAAARHLAAAKKGELSDVFNWLAAPTPEAWEALSATVRTALELSGYNPLTQRIRRAAK